MATYLLEIDYTLEDARGVLAQGGSARQAAAQAAAESGGGNVESFQVAFGGTDVHVRRFPPRSVTGSTGAGVAP